MMELERLLKKREEEQFQKVKEYLKENGKMPANEISRVTGVPIHIVNKFLQQGRLEIPDGEEIYIKCEKCGKDIKYGRFCQTCALDVCKQLQGMLTIGEIGEEPKHKKTKTGAQMHFLNKDM